MSDDRTPATGRMRLVAIGGAGAVVLLLSVVAVLAPAGRIGEPGPADPPPDPPAADAGAAPPAGMGATLLAGEGRSASHALGRRLPALAGADRAFESGDFALARDRYLDLLLEGGDFGGDGAAVLAWAHGRLALSMARCDVTDGQPAIGEPALTFRRSLR